MFHIVSSDDASFRTICSTDATNERELRKDGAFFWATVFERILSTRTDQPWDRLFFECWLENGHVIAYPQKRGDSPNRRKPEIIYQVNWAQELIAKLDNDISDDEEASINALIHIRLKKSFYNSYRIEPAVSSLKQALASLDFTAWMMPNGDRENMTKLEIFY